MNHSNNSHQEFIEKAQRISVEEAFEKVHSEKTSNGEITLFARNGTLHLVYCLPDETYVTTIEIQACWEAQCRLAADTSSVVAPRRFSEAAIDKAWKLGIELLVV